jgi:hypothetical protein
MKSRKAGQVNPHFLIAIPFFGLRSANSAMRILRMTRGMPLDDNDGCGTLHRHRRDHRRILALGAVLLRQMKDALRTG